MHESLLGDIQALGAACQTLRAVAPEHPDRGWDPTLDHDAILAMRAAWQQARTAYEHSEGALAPIFPDLDFSLDARYEDFLAELTEADATPFDDQGVVGLHAVERILYADVTPERISEYEARLDGASPARFPATAAEARLFREQLVARLSSDAALLEHQWTPANVDLSGAFSGLVSLMNEQREKVNKASTNEEESRYSQRTMADVRDNLAGARKVYGLFRAWLVSERNADATLDGPTIDAQVQAGFQRLEDLYAETPGDAIPPPPTSWSAEQPSAADLESPFGRLYAGVRAAVDPAAPQSIVASLRQAEARVGLAEH